MIKITWKQTEAWEHTGTDEKQNYVLICYHSSRNLKDWYWAVFRDEDKICSSIFEDEDEFTTADEAKARAEKALENYLNEKDSFTNCLSEVMKDDRYEETPLEKELDRLKFYYDKP